MDWFRSYHGAPLDAKHVTVAKRSETQPGVAAAVWWALLDHASQHHDRGSIEGFDPEIIANFFGWPIEIVQRVISTLHDMKVLSNGRITAWEKRQAKREDDSTPRVRGFRERQKAQRNEVKRDVTHGNAREEEIREEEIREEQKETTLHQPPAAAVADMREAVPEIGRSSFDRLIAAIPAEYQLDVVSLLRRAPSPLPWISELLVIPEGLHGVALPFTRLGQAIRDYNANNAELNMNLFRGYVRDIANPPVSRGAPKGRSRFPMTAADRQREILEGGA